MLLIHPPAAKACEPPAGIARLAGAIRGHGLPCTLLDANLEGQLFLLAAPAASTDIWSRRAGRNLTNNLASLRSPELYQNHARYRRSVADVNRMLEQTGKRHHLSLSLTNYQDEELSPLKSADLIRAAERPEANIFFPYFSTRLPGLIEESRPTLIGLSLNYLSQATTTFAMLGFLKKRYPGLPIALGGGLVTSWLRNPGFRNPFAGLIDHCLAGPGEETLIRLLAGNFSLGHHTPDYTDLPLTDYLAPGLILPYAASSGCYWNHCLFCPEKAEGNPYQQILPATVLADLAKLKTAIQPVQPSLLHFLDNAVSPALMQALAAEPPGLDWYGFARISPLLAEPDFCQALRRSGCRLLKLGLESGEQAVLDAMHKGQDLALSAKVLQALAEAGIATYIYLLFGTPAESLAEARHTLDFVVQHHAAITFLNLAVFNMPIGSPEAPSVTRSEFYGGDLSLYTDFEHPKGWSRKEIRRFLDQEFKRHSAIARILHRDPPLFTSNHAAFFC
ncbi:MAG TPA: radical SAM protein [Desulfobulbaceae bacterium]|nr:MAG: radical SAM protein [Deltaproteobacteria bacterium RIFOXYD12_FULL_53_23]HCC54189.1 radical SAM protein [Desulfobulbaceae bacterium]